MNSLELQNSWSITKEYLKNALELLPKNSIPGEEGQSIKQYQEYLVHNELELALDELAALGEANDCSSNFWNFLILAADNMNLKDRVSLYKNQTQKI